MNFIAPVLYLLTTYTIYKKIGTFFCLSVYVWLLHTISMTCFWIKADFLSGFDSEFTYFALAIMYFTLVLITLPLVKLEKSNITIKSLKSISSSKFKRLKFVCYILIGLSLYSIVFFSINLPKVFALDVKAVRDGHVIFYESSIYSKLAILGAFSSVFCIYFYYYLSILDTLPRIRKLLLFSSISFVLYTLNVAGRDGIVIWGLSFMAGLFFFYRFLKKELISSIFRTLLKVSIVVVPVLVFITTSRFSGNSNDNSEIESILSYAGQSLPNLSYTIDLTNKLGFRSGDGQIPIALLQPLTGKSDENRHEKIGDLMTYGFKSNQFKSYVGYFYPAYSFPILIIFILLFIFVIRVCSTRYIGSIDFVGFLPGFTWYMIPIVGIFYFYYGELIGNVFLLLPFLIKKYLK